MQRAGNPGRSSSHGLMITALLAFNSLGLFIRIRARHHETARAQAHAARPIRETLPVQSASPIEPGTTTWLWKQAKKERSSRETIVTSIPTKGSGQVVWQQSDRPSALHSSRARWLHRCGSWAPGFLSCFFGAPRPRGIVSIWSGLPIDHPHPHPLARPHSKRLPRKAGAVCTCCSALIPVIEEEAEKRGSKDGSGPERRHARPPAGTAQRNRAAGNNNFKRR